MNYKELNDNELISLAKENNEDAINLLHKKYQPLINKKCNKYYKYVKNKGVDLADLTQECLVGFEESINNFNPIDNVSFYTFTNVCMDRQLMTEIKRVNRDKNKLLNEAIPLETIDNEKDLNLIDYLQDNTDNPELGLLEEAEYQELYNKIAKNLTRLEESVFELRIQNFSYKEIADILDKDIKSIDNAVQRIKIKINEIKTK